MEGDESMINFTTTTKLFDDMDVDVELEVEYEVEEGEDYGPRSMTAPTATRCHCRRTRIHCTRARPCPTCR